MLKSTRRKAIDDARTAKKQEIDQHPTATQEEKDAKAKVDAEVQKAKDAITQANSNNDVDQVQNSETATIAGIQVDAVKKQMLNKQLMSTKKNEIDQHPTATQEEKDAKAKVDEEVAKAKRAIDSSTTNDAVDQAKDSGVTTINNIQPESIEKLKRSKRLMILLQPKRTP